MTEDVSRIAPGITHTKYSKGNMGKLVEMDDEMV
jgi:hypothetical protein